MRTPRVPSKAASSRSRRIRGVALAALLMAARAFADVPPDTSTQQDFNNPGTAYQAASTVGTAPVPLPSVLSPGPGATLNYLHLLDHSVTTATNSVTFDRSNPGGFTHMTADFDFRIVSSAGRGEGFGFALLNTSQYGWTGSILDAAEEPSFTASLGIGFDVHQDATDINNNHVSVHWDKGASAVVQQFDATPVVDLACGQWIHATIVAQTGGGSSTVNVLLTPPGGVPTSVVNNLSVPALVPFENRVYFAARNSSNTADYDVANVVVQYTGDPAILGQWSDVKPRQIIPIHSVFLPSGRIISWDRGYNGTFSTVPRLLDPVTWTETSTTDPGVELFCGGMTLRQDGKVLAAGGHLNNDGWGRISSFVYDEGTNVWTQLQDMNLGRWYPTLINLSNGDSVVMSGSYHDVPSNTNPTNTLPQVMSFATGTWRNLTSAVHGVSLYPMLHLAPSGNVFVSGPTNNDVGILNTAGTGSWTTAAIPSQFDRSYGNSILFDQGKLVVIGGGNTPTGVVDILDLTAPTLKWESAKGTIMPSMSYARRQQSATLLPDGTILVTGGTSSGASFNDGSGAVLAAELWDPATRNWRVLSGGAVPRMYHSETVLIPDGRVMYFGGGHPAPADGAGVQNGPDNFNGEIYSPPYLFKGPRPIVTSAPPLIWYGESIPVGMSASDAASITGVTLIAVNAMTHAFDMNVRLLKPAFALGVGGLTVTAPVDPNLCPPGYYQLFCLNSAGVPSIGQIMHIGPNQPPVASATASATVEATGPGGAQVLLDGSASSDPENAALTYTWKDNGTTIATGATPSVGLALGSHTITLVVTDPGSLTSSTTITVTVSDTTPPTIQTLTATPNLLRSVGNALVPVTISGTATDLVTASPTLSLQQVTSNEPDPTGNPGDMSPDVVLTPGSMIASLRSERFTYVRVYTVTVQAADGSGNTSTSTVPVRVRGKWFP